MPEGLAIERGLGEATALDWLEVCLERVTVERRGRLLSFSFRSRLESLGFIVSSPVFIKAGLHVGKVEALLKGLFLLLCF